MKTLIFLLLTITGLTAQNCYDFNSKSDLPVDIGYYYNQGFNMATVGYKNVTVIGNMYKIGGLVNYLTNKTYIEGEFVYSHSDMKLLDVEDEYGFNKDTYRVSAYYLFPQKNFEVTPMIGFSYQNYQGEDLALPEIGLLGRFPHFDLICGINHKILRTRIVISL